MSHSLGLVAFPYTMSTSILKGTHLYPSVNTGIIVKQFAQGLQCNDRDSNPHSDDLHVTTKT